MSSEETPEFLRRTYTIPAVVAAILLFVALGKLPYGYYIFLRWAICAAAIFVAYTAGYLRKVWWTVWLLAAVAIIFNPIAPIHLDRSAWRVIDIAAAIAFLASTFVPGPEKRE